VRRQRWWQRPALAMRRNCPFFNDNSWRPPPRTWAPRGLSEKRPRSLKTGPRVGDSRH